MKEARFHDRPQERLGGAPIAEAGSMLQSLSEVLKSKGELVMTTEAGGPAFPRQLVWDSRDKMIDHGNTGMSLRDWFAGQALIATAIIASESHGMSPNPPVLARDAYEIADEMLKLR